ncbi:hypothetical protein JIQ42_04291 [Leishmania sp. Namibia]|uniref:hypothetical protein n=1 Tax=Leishmania sp. Namibia TaxID=2802991 RepID=UPI001B564333|nr:hypothetical protein JIQ42_04291 [Leishmania sp. Namibia]
MPSASSAVRSGAPLTVDELEEKLATLHDYLSTPYRARAEAILQQRRRREARGAVSEPDKDLSEAAESNEVRAALELASVSFDSPAPNPKPSLEAKNANSVERTRSVSHVPAVAAASIIPTELKNGCGSEHELAKGGGGSGVPEPSPTVHASVGSPLMDPQTRRYVQQLEWQVSMLADALQQERQRLEEIDVRVVQPLLRFGETALQRQVQLEYALASCRAQRCDEKD